MIDSFKKNKTGIIIMFFSSLFVCAGQLMWKLSINNVLYLFIGFCLYGVGAVLMLLAYGHGSLSVLQPMLSLNYVITIILAYYVLEESVTVFKIVGIIIIMFGVYLIGGGDE